MNIVPLSDRVIVNPEQQQEKTASGIIIPDNARSKPSKGVVIACGEGKPGEPMTVKPGDQILFSKNAGVEMEFEGKKQLLMRESDIIAIIRK